MDLWLLAALIVLAVAAAGWSIGRRSALRAERAWRGSWFVYLFLGAGMTFGAIATSHLLLAAFLWSKVFVFLALGSWLFLRRVRTAPPRPVDLAG
ncbi:MAG: hypothetical protein HYX53_10810 [Chloroflexi bacterium]|nr:hypothetical protein [Chloroflexota bacterium]